MDHRLSDFERLREFVQRGDQRAFAAIARQHLNLVYATALRKVEDPGAAEEIAQNVFTVLARKAWRFAPEDSLPAWLHQTTLFESKAWLRGELRRRRREQTAAELGTTMNTPDEQPAFHSLVPLLDDALLYLREKDRTALLLRYYESRSLREVGAALGVSDDAARKRVQGALEKLSQYFQRLGFSTATVAASAAVLEHTAVSAPATTASVVVNAALQASPPAFAVLTALLARFVGLTRGRKATVFIGAAAALLIWLWHGKPKTEEAALPAPPQLVASQTAFRRPRGTSTLRGISPADPTQSAEQTVDGYEAMGHLTYTSFSTSSKPSYKAVMMFDVKVGPNNWRIRTEPVIENKGGIGFYEASFSTNDFIFSITGLAPAYKSSESPFQGLRAELKQSEKLEVYFTNTPVPIPPFISNFSRATAAGGIDNVAVAVTVKGQYPPVDPSFVAFLWFAFTPPNAHVDGTNKMLLQIWDDGNPQKCRFRQAKWTQFPELPYVPSSAVYDWFGKELLPDGTLGVIDISDVVKPLETAARYEVVVATNFNGLMLPRNFKLTRFATQRSENEEPEVSSTVVASVVNFRRISSDESLEVHVPGKTFVSDYRLSGGEMKSLPAAYFLNSNSLPAVEPVKPVSR